MGQSDNSGGLTGKLESIRGTDPVQEEGCAEIQESEVTERRMDKSPGSLGG